MAAYIKPVTLHRAVPGHYRDVQNDNFPVLPICATPKDYDPDAAYADCIRMEIGDALRLIGYGLASALILVGTLYFVVRGL